MLKISKSGCCCCWVYSNALSLWELLSVLKTRRETRNMIFFYRYHTKMTILEIRIVLAHLVLLASESNLNEWEGCEGAEEGDWGSTHLPYCCQLIIPVEFYYSTYNMNIYCFSVGNQLIWAEMQSPDERNHRGWKCMGTQLCSNLQNLPCKNGGCYDIHIYNYLHKFMENLIRWDFMICWPLV